MNSRPASQVSSSMNPSEILAVFFRHKKKAILIPLLIVGLGVLVILFAPRKYMSEAKIFLQVGRESVKLDPTATTLDTIHMMQGDRAQEVITTIDMLKSRGLLTKVVNTLGPDVVLGETEQDDTEPNPLVESLKQGLANVMRVVKSIDPISPTESAIVYLERHMDVEAEHDSTLIAIRIQAKTPQLAQRITSKLIDIYQQEHLRMHRTSGSKEFFSEQHDALRQQLDRAVDELRVAKNRLNIVSLESRRGTLESRLAGLEVNRNETLRELAGVQARVAALKSQIAAMPERILAEETTLPNTGADMLRSQLYALQVQMMDQQSKYSDDHPALRATREQIKQAEAELARVTTERQQKVSGVNPNQQSLALSLAEAESELASLLAQREQLANLITDASADLKTLNDNELEIDRLEREQQLARANFYRYAENLEKARIDQELDKERISNVIVAQSATLAEKPVSPSKLIVGALSLVMAVCSGIILVLLGEKLDDRIYGVEQLERTLQLPTLAVIPNKREYARVAT